MPRPRSGIAQDPRSPPSHVRLAGIAAGLPTTTVADYVARAQRAGLGWPLPEGMDDSQLEARLFVTAGPPQHNRPLPDWLHVHRELRRPDVTLQLLHLEYRERFPEGYEYSQFCRRYRLWQRPLDVVMRQEHRAGEKLFVDFAGRTVPSSTRSAA
jgi:transposase